MLNTNITISVIVPCFENFSSFKRSFQSVLEQSCRPNEIIIVDSSKTNKIKKFIIDAPSLINGISIIYIHKNNMFPGKARNIGVENSNCDWIAFLDSKTYAKPNWLSSYKELVLKKNYDVVFGSTKFISKKDKKISKLFLYSTFGNKSHCTVPGTLISKLFFKQNNFLENVRSGEDILWRQKLIDNFLINHFIPKENYYTIYDQISNKINANLYKHFTYSIHSSTISIKNKIKDIYLSFFLILTALIVPKWNVLIGGWDTNPLYVPNITKLYILTLTIILFTYLLLKNVVSSFKFLKDTLIFKIIFFILFIFFSIFILRWNEEYSLRYYNTIFKFPHITKIYLFIIIFFSIIYRGLFVPLKNDVKINELKYLKWIKIGVLGLMIDIVKSPAFIFGSIISIFRLQIFFNNKTINKYRKKMLIICPFPYDVQAGQRLKYEQHLKDFYLRGYDIKISSFINNKTWKIIFKKGYILTKFFALIFGYLRRIFLLLSIKKYDCIYVFMWIVPYTSVYVEKIFRKFSKKIIYDMEDNILIVSKNEINPLSSSFKSVDKYNYLIKSSDQIIVSSKYLETFCNNLTNKNNSNYICASINLDRYKPIIKQNKKTISIGWTGTFSTKKYLKVIEPVIKKLSKIRNINFIVISDFDYILEGVNVLNIKWNKMNEIKDLQKIDIGVYPLFKDEWVLGKSGLKALQYMALSIPTISTNYGNIKDIINNEQNGFLVNNSDEWLKILIKLCDDIDLRNFIGNNGRKVVEKYYSLKVISKKYQSVIKKL